MSPRLASALTIVTLPIDLLEPQSPQDGFCAVATAEMSTAAAQATARLRCMVLRCAEQVWVQGARRTERIASRREFLCERKENGNGRRRTRGHDRALHQPTPAWCGSGTSGTVGPTEGETKLRLRASRQASTAAAHAAPMPPPNRPSNTRWRPHFFFTYSCLPGRRRGGPPDPPGHPPALAAVRGAAPPNDEALLAPHWAPPRVSCASPDRWHRSFTAALPVPLGRVPPVSFSPGEEGRRGSGIRSSAEPAPVRPDTPRALLGRPARPRGATACIRGLVSLWE